MNLFYESLSFCLFSIGQYYCIVCPSIYVYWLHHWSIQTFLSVLLVLIYNSCYTFTVKPAYLAITYFYKTISSFSPRPVYYDSCVNKYCILLERELYMLCRREFLISYRLLIRMVHYGGNIYYLGWMSTSVIAE